MTRLNGCFSAGADEEIADTFAVRAFRIAVISGCLTGRTFGPIEWLDSHCVNAIAALLAAGFATATVCDSHVVTSAAALSTTRNRQFSLHSLMIRAFACADETPPRITVASYSMSVC